MSLVSFIGPRPNLLDLEGRRAQALEVRQPIISNEGLEKIRAIGDIADNQFQTMTLDITLHVQRGADIWKRRLKPLCARRKSVAQGYNIIILSDRLLAADRVAIPRCWRRRRCTIT